MIAIAISRTSCGQINPERKGTTRRIRPQALAPTGDRQQGCLAGPRAWEKKALNPAAVFQ